MKKILLWIQDKSTLLIALILIVPLMLTYYAWKITAQNVEETQRTKFETLTQECEKALLYRMESYYQALLGGKGFYEGSTNVERHEWKAYVAAIDVLKNFPGINGIGTIYDVKTEALATFLQQARADGSPEFRIHPEGLYPENFIIKYIEPENINIEAVGLNIGFESNRRQAAIKSRDSGKPAITKRILLVQDAEKTPGFLLLMPTYDNDKPTNTIEQRRTAFKHWLYAPFIGKNFLQKLTDNQGKTFHLQVYDGTKSSKEALIYDSHSRDQAPFKSKFTLIKKISLMQQDWLLVWSSTEEFENLENSQEPFLILVTGLMFTGLFAVFVTVMTIRSGKTKNIILKNYIIPILAFLLTLTATFYLQQEISLKERIFIDNANKDASNAIADTIIKNTESRIQALDRMARRWSLRNGTPYQEWKEDAKHYIKDQPGLKSIKWLDTSYRIRWSEPLEENNNVISLNTLLNKELEQSLKGTTEKNIETISPPVELSEGQKLFTSSFPVYKNNQFDGFIVGIFAIHELMNTSLSGYNKTEFIIQLEYNDKRFYNSSDIDKDANKEWGITKTINIYDKQWKLVIYPTAEFIHNNTSFLPYLIFAIGAILALMIALIINFAQQSKQQTALVEEKENLLATFVKHTPAAVAMFDNDIRYVAASDRWYTDYRLSHKNIIGKYHYDIFPEILENHPQWLELHKRVINGEVIKSDEEMFIRKNGETEWLRYELRPWSKRHNEPGGLIMFTENISERKRVEVMKDEFISTVNHELRTPLTSIQGSLSLLKSHIYQSIDEKGKRLLELSYNNCGRLAQLVNDILDMEKIAAGKMEYNIQPMEMISFTHEIINQNHSYAEKYNVILEIKSQLEKIYCNIDPNRFTQALTNLISNAAKFSPDGGLVTISLRLDSDGKLRISVTDRGPGIPHTFREMVFRKFSQADSSSTRHKGGTGLGLNITKSIIEALNGHVTFDTHVGLGTTFHFILNTCNSPQSKNE